MADKYRLLTESVKFDYGTENGARGEAAFINDPVGPYSSIPVMGAPWAFLGTTAVSCVLRNIHIEYLEGDVSRIRYQLSYSSAKEGSDNSGRNTPSDPEARTWDYGGEFQTISGTAAGWVWGTGTVPIGDKQLPIRILSIGFSRPTATLSSTTSLVEAIKACAGMVNHAEFEGWPAGCVLCLGARGGTFRNEHGGLRYRFEIQFQVRLIPGKANNGWQYILDDTGVWQTPMNSGKYLYGTADFSTLF